MPIQTSVTFINAYREGKEKSGILTFARDLATEFRLLNQGAVQYLELPLSGFPLRDAAACTRVARACRNDLLLVQYSPNLLPTDVLMPFLLMVICLRSRLGIVLHDTNAAKTGGRTARLAFEVLPRIVKCAFVFDEVERIQLCQSNNLHVVPHFVRRRPQIAKAAARRRVGLPQTAKVGGILGFIHRRKGYHFALDMLKEDRTLDYLVFAGSFIDQEYEGELRRSIDKLCLRERVIITGYLSADRLMDWGAACDVGLCPFLGMSASGSLSDWISLRRPIAASNLPQLEPYATMAPNAIQLSDTSNARHFSIAVGRLLEQSDVVSGQLAKLAEQLSIEQIASRYCRLLHTAISPRKAI